MDIDRLEALALAEDRDAALAELVPGTEEHDYWSAVRHQHKGELDAVDALLDRWRTRFGDTAMRQRIERRQLVLRVDGDLPANASALADALAVRLDHPREVEQAAATLPTALDPSLLATDAVLDAGLRRDRQLGGLTDEALPYLLAEQGRPLDVHRRRALLTRLQRSGLPGLVDALVADREAHKGEDFGALSIHHLLVLDELEALAARVPAVRTEAAWVLARICRMRPPEHVDLALDDDARAAFLDAVWAQIAELPPAFNSLKVHVLYHRLVCDQLADKIDRDRLLTYLALPRQAAYIDHARIRDLHHRELADLGQDFGSATGLPPVRDDERLIRSMLAGLLLDEDIEAFAPYLDRGWLGRLLAETRLLAGVGEAERWTRTLGPAAVTALRDRVDIELLPSNPRRVPADASVALDVALKNCWPLRIRVFRIHTASTGGEVDSSIDLDGLSARFEEIREAPVPPMQQIRERIALPACDRPGTYVVELIGNGRASRAVIRKGTLVAIPRRTAAGLAVSVVGEDGALRPQATIRMGERELSPREDGAIPIPFSTDPHGGVRQVLLCDEDLVVRAGLVLPSESYALSVAVLLDRQSLVAGSVAKALVRAELTVSGAPVPLSLLEDPYVEITTLDRLGVPVRRRRPLALHDGREAEVRIVVPEHLAELSVAVGGRVRVISAQRSDDLRHEVSIPVGTMHTGPATEAVFLARGTDGYSLRLLGKSGEPRGSRALFVSLDHALLTGTVDVALATDPDGVVRLGELPGVVGLRVTGPDGNAQRFELRPLPPNGRPQAATIEGEPVALSLPPDAVWQLVELRGDAPAADRSEEATLVAGTLRIDGLGAGVYEVKTLGGPVARIRVLPRTALLDGGWAWSAGRAWELASPGAFLAGAALDGDRLVVSVERASPRTRVHLLGAPLWPSAAWSADLAFALPPLGAHSAPLRRTEILSGRDIGDEYRYVLDRRRLPHRPGTLLERPSLLLNPWALRVTRTTSQAAKGGGGWDAAKSREEAFYASGAISADAASRLGGPGYGGGAGAHDESFAAYDFLARPPVLLASLQPDADGKIEVPLADLAGLSLVRVLCVDPRGVTSSTVPIGPSGAAVRDLRLPEALSDDRHVREVRELRAALPDAPVRIDDRATARFEVVGTIESLYRALCALSGDADLAQWSFLPRWAALDREERLSLYNERACHELSLFVRFKDPELFEGVVRPYLTNKLHKTFIDRWLLGEDLSRYLAPDALGRLNAVERALLARALPPERAAERAALIRTLADAVALRSPSVDGARDDRLVDVLLAGAVAGGEDGAPPEPQEAPKPPPPPAGAPAPAARTLAGGAAPRRAAMKQKAKKERDRSRADENEDESESFDLDLMDREQAAPMYRGVDKTREWAEHNWWHRRIEDQGPGLVVPARLWRDLAAHEGGPFLSPHLSDASDSFAACVCALAVTDLPFFAEPPEVVPDREREVGGGATVRVQRPALVAVAALAPLTGEPSGSALVGQAIYRGDDRWEWDGAEQREKPVTGELVAGVRYEGQVVVSNPTSRTRILDVLAQIPAGALPVGGSVATRTVRLHLAPYATDTVEFQFYFPSPGTFAQYGARVAQGRELVAAAAGRTLSVLAVAASGDPGAWPHVSQHGTLEQVIDFLQTRDLGRVDLDRIAWRLADRGAFERITAALAARLVYHDTVWSYALRHHDRVRAAEWLSRQDALLDQIGPLRCGLVDADPLLRGRYQHLEYAPLVNARAHLLGERRQVLNDGLQTQWRALLERIATSEAPDASDWMAAAGALLTMDRAAEAARILARAPRGGTEAQLQHDYLSAWLAVGARELETARALAAPHAAHPLLRWRRRFAALIAVLDAALGRAAAPPSGADVRDDREARMSELAARQPALSVEIKDGHLVLDHARIGSVRVRVYPMDVELLFSREPFLAAGSERFTRVEPARDEPQTLVDPEGPAKTRIPLADVLLGERLSQNAVIEVVAGPIRRVVTHFANDLSVTVASSYGRLSVRRASDGAPLPGAYVKVYARSRGGGVAFYKDGYTDLLGWFDHATLSTDDLDRVERFAVLVVHDEAGASVLEAEPPSR